MADIALLHLDAPLELAEGAEFGYELGLHEMADGNC